MGECGCGYFGRYLVDILPTPVHCTPAAPTPEETLGVFDVHCRRCVSIPSLVVMSTSQLLMLTLH